MNTIFIGGSRRISHLPAHAKDRLNNVIGSGLNVLVGDANGTDKAVQKYLLESAYRKVTVFCSGGRCRNNLGNWPTRNIQAPKRANGFQFYALKDREMAREADFGLMIWDGKSSGTVLNVLRLIGARKKAVLLNAPEKSAISFKTPADWTAFLAQCTAELRHDLRERATPEEWRLCESPEQANFLDTFDGQRTSSERHEEQGQTEDKLTTAINLALGSGDLRTVVDVLGSLARARGMSQVAQDTGLARESLYRALSADGNPEFATILKVLNAVGLRLMVGKEDAGHVGSGD
jgi:probable addiction module antidote protein